MVRQDIWWKLVNRQHLFKELRTSPEILHTRIERPVFILGLPFSGTTQLHRLLAHDPLSRFRAPYMFEMLCPVNVFDRESKPNNEESTKATRIEDLETNMHDYLSSTPDLRLRKACIKYLYFAICSHIKSD
jgi:hypothetical protein